MSSTAISSPNFQSILNAAFDNYAKQTGIDLISHSSAQKLQSCHTSEDVLQLLQEREAAFKDYRNKNRKLINCLRPVVQVVHALNGVLGKVAGIVPFHPTKAIFVAIDILLAAAASVSANYDALGDLFGCVGNFLKRLDIYIERISLAPAMSDILVKIMTEVLGVLSVATKQIKQGRFTKFARKLLGESEIEAILQRLDRLTDEEARVTAVHTLEVIHGLVNNLKGIMDDGKASSEGIQRTLVKIQEIAGEMHKTERNQLQEKIRHWLHPPDPSTNHNIALRQHHRGTATWFTQGNSFIDWKATGSLLWVYGKPGSGKSILCSSIIREVQVLHDSGLAQMTYFYCDFRDPRKQDVSGLLASLLAQLSARSDPCYNILSSLYSKYDAGSRQPNDDELWECLEMILKMEGQPPIYVIVDAIDECPNTSGVVSPRDRVLELVEKLLGLQLSNVHICITSRPEADIRASLEPLASHTVSLHDQSGQKNDISDYVGFIVHSDRNMRNWRPEDKKLAIESLSQKADGMFRWIVCQLAMLRRCIPAAIRRALDDLPESLDETYERILLSIGQERRDYAQRLLQCLAVSMRPLRTDEVADILAIQFDAGPLPIYNVALRPMDSEEAVLSTCSSLITIVNVNGASVVQFSHFSVKEYLTSERLAKSGKNLSRYHIFSASAHATLARFCLSVLLALDDQVDKNSMTNISLAPYAAQHWVDHAQVQNVSSSIEDAMDLLFDPFKPHFATWVWIYDIDYPYREIMFTDHPTTPEAVPLYYATLCGFRGVVERLAIRYPNDVNAKGGYYSTPLHAAARKMDVEMTRMLLAYQADPTVMDVVKLTPLHQAWLRRHGDIVELLLNYTDIDTRDGHGGTLLHLTSGIGLTDDVRSLLQGGATVDFQDNGGRTPLGHASIYGNVDAAHLLLQSGADVGSRCNNGSTPLMIASENGHADIMHLLLQSGAAVDSRRNDGSTPLLVASANGHVDAAHLLLRSGAAVDSRRNDGSTPLMVASTNGHVDAAHLLLRSGAAVDSRRNDGSTPLMVTSANGHPDVMHSLLQSGVVVDLSDRSYAIDWTPLHFASMNGHLNVAQLLIEYRADLEVRNGNQETHLHLASSYGRPEIVRLLLRSGSHPNLQDKNGCTPLHEAARGGHLEIVKLLLESGAEFNTRNGDNQTAFDVASRNGMREASRFLAVSVGGMDLQDVMGDTQPGTAFQSPVSSGATQSSLGHREEAIDDDERAISLHTASSKGDIAVVQALLDNGAEVNKRDVDNRTPLYLASWHGRSKVAILLIEHGAEVNSRDKLGQTSLHFASRGGHVELARSLLDHGADVNTRMQDQSMPLHLAAHSSNSGIVRLLLERGANVHARDEAGLTPITLTWTTQDILSNQIRLHSALEITKLLEEYGAIDQGKFPDIIWDRTNRST